MTEPCDWCGRGPASYVMVPLAVVMWNRVRPDEPRAELHVCNEACRGYLNAYIDMLASSPSGGRRRDA